MGPLFFKNLLQPSCLFLQLPSDFVRKHMNNQVPKDIKIQSANGGYVWSLKSGRFGESYCFGNGWINVVEDAHLGLLDFMLFELVDPSTFKLIIFTPYGFEKDFPPKPQVQNVDLSVLDDDDDKQEDDGDYGDDDDKQEDDGYSDDDDFIDVDDDVEDDDDDSDVDDDDIMFKITIYKKSMRLRVEFLRLARIKSLTSIMLKNLNGEEWEIGVWSNINDPTDRRLSSGWADFRKSNNLSVGDECVFNYNRCEGKLCLTQVIKKKNPPNKPPSTKKSHGHI